MMELYDVLTDRRAINLLWLSYTKEVIEKRGYTTKLSEIRNHLRIDESIISSLKKLDESKLITYEYVQGEYFISITQKGKQFIETFSKLKDIYFEIKEKPKSIKIDYSLNEFEKKLLDVTQNLAKEGGTTLVSIKNLAAELYPLEDYKQRAASIKKCIKRLEDLNLISKYKAGKEDYIRLNQSGERIVSENPVQNIKQE